MVSYLKIMMKEKQECAHAITFELFESSEDPLVLTKNFLGITSSSFNY